MMTPEETESIALSLADTDKKRHFNRIAFTVKKKIFATLSFDDETLNVRLTPKLQIIYCPPESEVIMPLDNAWGRQGWTSINLKKATKKLIQSVLKDAYEERKK